MPVAVDPDEPPPGLIVERKRHVRAPCRAQHRCEVHEDGVEENVWSARLPAQIMRLAGQFLGASEVPDRAPAVDQVGGGPKRVHVVHAQVVTAPLEHMLAFLERVPVVAGLAQRGGEPFARVQPADVLPAADRLELGDDPPSNVKRFLVKAEAA